MTAEECAREVMRMDIINKGGDPAWLDQRLGPDPKIIALRKALEEFLAHEVEYMTINNLGDPEKQQRVINARAALGL